MSVRTPRVGGTALTRCWRSPEVPQPRIHKRPETFDMVDVNAVIRNELFEVNDGLRVIGGSCSVAAYPPHSGHSR